MSHYEHHADGGHSVFNYLNIDVSMVVANELSEVGASLFQSVLLFNFEF
jgi:hypothetical protein